MGVTFLRGRASGGKRKVGELGHVQPQAVKQLKGLLVAQAAFFLVFFEQGIKVLIHAAVGDDRAGALLQPGKRLCEPLRLHGLMKGAGREFGHAFAVFRDLQQFPHAGRVLLVRGLFPGQRGMAARPYDNGLTGEDHRFKEGLFAERICEAEGVKSGESLLCFGLDRGEAPVDDLGIVQHPLLAGAIRGGFTAYEAGGIPFFIVIREMPGFIRQGTDEIFMEGLALPVGRDLFHYHAHVFRVGMDGSGRAVGKIVHGFAHEIAIQLGVQDAVAPLVRTAAAHNELAVIHVDGDVFRNVP